MRCKKSIIHSICMEIKPHKENQTKKLLNRIKTETNQTKIKTNKVKIK